MESKSDLVSANCKLLLENSKQRSSLRVSNTPNLTLLYLILISVLSTATHQVFRVRNRKDLVSIPRAETKAN